MHLLEYPFRLEYSAIVIQSGCVKLKANYYKMQEICCCILLYKMILCGIFVY